MSAASARSFWQRPFAECTVTDDVVDVAFESPRTWEGRTCTLDDYFKEGSPAGQAVRRILAWQMPDDLAEIEADIRRRLSDRGRPLPPAPEPTSAPEPSSWNTAFARCTVTDSAIDLDFGPNRWKNLHCEPAEYFDGQSPAGLTMRRTITHEMPEVAAEIEADLRQRLANLNRSLLPSSAPSDPGPAEPARSYWQDDEHAECTVTDSEVKFGIEGARWETYRCKLDEYFTPQRAEDGRLTMREMIARYIPHHATEIEMNIRRRLADPNRAAPPPLAPPASGTPGRKKWWPFG